jgi:hypothetical protein
MSGVNLRVPSKLKDTLIQLSGDKWKFNVMSHIVAFSKREFQRYPAREYHKMKWVSDKQRRFVMSQIRSGAIQVPRVRTFDLYKNWKGKVNRSGSKGQLYNPLPYASYVHGDQSQYWMHTRSGWPRVRDILVRTSQNMVKIASDTIDFIIKKAG